jgi:hypothetical protein
MTGLEGEGHAIEDVESAAGRGKFLTDGGDL